MQTKQELIDEKIENLVSDIRFNQNLIDQMEYNNTVAKEQLRILLEQKGEPWIDDKGYARLEGESIRRSYDTQALDDLIINDPLRYGWLVDYRKSITIRASLKVK